MRRRRDAVVVVECSLGEAITRPPSRPTLQLRSCASGPPHLLAGQTIAGARGGEYGSSMLLSRKSDGFFHCSARTERAALLGVPERRWSAKHPVQIVHRDGHLHQQLQLRHGIQRVPQQLSHHTLVHHSHHRRPCLRARRLCSMDLSSHLARSHASHANERLWMEPRATQATYFHGHMGAALRFPSPNPRTALVTYPQTTKNKGAGMIAPMICRRLNLSCSRTSH